MVLGRHNETKQAYAVKVMDKAKLDTTRRIQRVLTEIAILKECSHENILRLYETYESALDISLVLELYIRPQTTSNYSLFLFFLCFYVGWKVGSCSI